MKKILLISNMYPNAKYPNYGVFVQNTEEILKEMGFEVNRIVLNKQPNKFVKLWGYMNYYISIFLTVLFFKHDMIYVHYAAHNSFPLLALKKVKRNLKIYTNVHGSDIVPETSFQLKLQKYVKKLLQISDKVITPSNYFKNLIVNELKIAKEKIDVFPSGGVNSKVFHKIEEKDQLFKELGLDPHQQYIGYVGRIDYQKGWDVLLEAVHLLQEEGHLANRKIIMVGNGKDYDRFQALINKYKIGDKIIYYDMLPQSKLNEIYNCLDVFVFPTMRKGESLGLVGLEAMACGVPVIGSSIGGLLDYIKEEENGLFFNIGDSNDLKDKVLKFFRYNQEKINLMRAEAFYTATQYEVEFIKGKLQSIFTRNEQS